MWHLAHLDAGALAILTSGGDGVQVRSAPSHRPQLQACHLGFAATPVAAFSSDASEDCTPSPNAGRGVLVGIIDTGIDLTHEAFFDGAGRSRVVAVWDQDATLPSGTRHPGIGHYVPSAFGYGHACDQRAIDLGSCLFDDLTGHGTHVASIAAGAAPGAQGRAAEADIALVRSAHFTQLADAVAYLDTLAQTRGQPLVINISVGGHYGPHDGRTPLEVYLNQMAKAGRIIVAAAGNDGHSAVHVGFELEAVAKRIVLEPESGNSDAQADVDFWLPKDATVAWAVELWEHGAPTAQLRLDSPLGTVGQAVVTRQDGQVLTAVRFVQEVVPEHAMLHLGLQFTGAPAGGLIDSCAPCLVLRFSGDGNLQGWVGQGSASGSAWHFGRALGPGFVSGDSHRTVSVPATAPRLLAVGSYTVQNVWMPQWGGLMFLQGALIGARSPFSSLGPTGAAGSTGVKPDVCAPGSIIAAARSSLVADGPMTLSARQMVMQGTSMAAPHVTGVVAQMLAADGSLEPRDVRRLLQQTARTDAYTGETPNASWGYGKLDGDAALAATQTAQQGCAAVHSVLGSWLLPLYVLRRRLVGCLLRCLFKLGAAHTLEHSGRRRLGRHAA